MSENVNLGRTGKFGSVNLDNLKGGVKRSELTNAEHIKVFDKFDKDKNGVLSEDEVQELVNSLGNYAQDGKITRREAGKFLKENGLKGEMKKKEALKFLQQFSILSDNIENTTMSEWKDGTQIINVEYKPDENGVKITEFINKENGELYGKKTVKDGKTVTQFYTPDGKLSKEITEENSVKTIVQYDENGNITSVVRQKGSVTEFLNSEGRVVKKETDKGSNNKEIVEYEYDSDGNVVKTTTTNPDGTQIIDDGVNITTINKDGSKIVENKETGEIQEFDTDGNLIEENPVEETPVEETPEAEPYKHQTQLGDTWYGIVQAKYGITDHKQTMEIVRQLKAQNNVSPKATNMPKEIILPDTVTLKDGTEVQLANKDAVVDTSHNNITNVNHSYNLKEQAEKNEAIRKEGTEIAEALYNDMKGVGTSDTFSANLEKITKDNVAAVVLGYREFSNDESLTEAILDEVGMSIDKRRDALKGIFNKLVEKAKEQGIETASFEEQFYAQIDKATTWGSDKFDTIFEGLASGINGASILTSKDIKDIQNMSAEEQQEYTVTQLDNVLENSQKSFENQLATDGWAGKTVDWMSGLWGSENRKKFVKEDLEAFEAQVEELRAAKTEDEFKAKFNEIFGTEFNPNMIKAYEKRQQQLVLAKAAYGIEQYFNTTVENLLKNETLSEERQSVTIASTNTGAYNSSTVTATKEQVFERDFNAFAEFVGQGDIEAGKAELGQALTAAGLDLSKATQEEKYTALHNLAKTYSQILHNNTLAASENKGFEAFNNECETMYNAAFGTTNDIAKRVQDYNTSQQAGASALKTGVVITAGALATVATGGASLAVTAAAVGATTTASRVIVEVSDLATNAIEGDINRETLSAITEQAVQEGLIAGGSAGVLKVGGSLLKGAGKTVTSSEQALVVRSSEQALARTGTNTANTASRAAASSTARSGAQNAATNLLDDGGVAANKSFLQEVLSETSKVGRDALNSLDDKALSRLADILGKEPAALKTISRKEVLQLLQKFHPDVNTTLPYEYATTITQLLNSLL